MAIPFSSSNADIQAKAMARALSVSLHLFFTAQAKKTQGSRGNCSQGKVSWVGKHMVFLTTEPRLMAEATHAHGYHHDHLKAYVSI